MDELSRVSARQSNLSFLLWTLVGAVLNRKENYFHLDAALGSRKLSSSSVWVITDRGEVGLLFQASVSSSAKCKWR